MDFNVLDAVRAGFESVTYVVRREILDDVRTHVDSTLGGRFETNFVCQELTAIPAGFLAPPDRAKPWGTTHAVLCAAETLDGPLAVCNADDLYGPEAFSLLHGQISQEPPSTDAALVAYTLDKTLSGAGGVARGICVVTEHDLLERVTEAQNVHRRDGRISGVGTDGTPVELSGQEMVSMNLWGFTPTAIERLRRQFRQFLETWGADPEKECYLSAEVNAQIERDATRVRVLQAPDTWVGVTHAVDRDRAEALLKERVASGAYPRRLGDALKTLS